MKLNIKPCPQMGVCLVCAAPALASSTASLPYAAACGCILLLAGCGAVIAVKLAKGVPWVLLPQFAAIMISVALSLGGELVANAAFPNLFDEAPTFVLTGAPLFFAACFSLSSAEKPLLPNLCCVLASALLVIILGVFRSFLSFLPLAEDVSMGLVFAAVAIAIIRLLMPDKEEKAWES